MLYNRGMEPHNHQFNCRLPKSAIRKIAAFQKELGISQADVILMALRALGEKEKIGIEPAKTS